LPVKLKAPVFCVKEPATVVAPAALTVMGVVALAPIVKEPVAVLMPLPTNKVSAFGIKVDLPPLLIIALKLAITYLEKWLKF
jgi:hypothetical protein